MHEIAVPLCPYCTASAVLSPGSEFKTNHAQVWGCKPCRAWVGIWTDSPVRKPMGRLAKDDLRALQVRARLAFDGVLRTAMEHPGWTGKLARQKAYAWLGRAMGMPANGCDPGFFDEAQARRMVEVCEALALPGRRRAA